ncbi:MAG: sulfotransferase [Roseovarius sp.]|nr:sulfotransferase [Roseovarius sp.]
METKGWFPFPGTQLHAIDLGWTHNEIQAFANQSHSLLEFADNLFQKQMMEDHASVWVEKTPSNSYCFRQFLHLDPTNKVILCVRNPKDTIASLVNRGMSEFFATVLWVYNIQSALALRESPRFFLVKYEDLVKFPEETLSGVCRFIGVDFHKQLPSHHIEKKDLYSKLSTWQNDPGDTIKASPSTFANLPERQQARVIAAMNFVRVFSGSQHTDERAEYNCIDVAELLSYETSDISSSGYSFLYPQMIGDWTKRLLLGYSTKLSGYPARIRS